MEKTKPNWACELLDLRLSASGRLEPRPAHGESASDLITAKQIGFIRTLARDIGIVGYGQSPDELSRFMFGFPVDELCKNAASILIEELKNNPQDCF